MSILITAQHEGYRRCGVAHSTTPTRWPIERFSEDELKRLQADPRLTVVLLDDDGEGKGTQDTDPAATPEVVPEAKPEPKGKGKR